MAPSKLSDDALKSELVALRGEVQANTHTLDQVLSGRYQVGLEGQGGRDVDRAEREGLYVNRRLRLYARTPGAARPLEEFARKHGGKFYFTPTAEGRKAMLEVSRLLGYSNGNIKTFSRFLTLSREAEVRGVEWR